MTLVVLAAGMGSRYGGLKQIDPMTPHGEFIIDFSIFDAIRAGFDRVVFIIRKDIEELFRNSVGRRIEKKCDVAYAYQALDDLPAGFSLPEGRTKPWGTGQALMACRNMLDGPFCVLNADDYYGAHAFEQMNAGLENVRFDNGKLHCSMAGYVLANTLSHCGAVTRGLCRTDERGQLRAIREVKGILMHDGRPCVEEGGELRRLDGNTSVSMNFWGLPAEFIPYLEERFPVFLERVPEGDIKAEFLLPTIMGEMIELDRGGVQLIPTREIWFGMTYAEDRELARERIADLIAIGAYPEHV
jgi:hypothetical protein